MAVNPLPRVNIDHQAIGCRIKDVDTPALLLDIQATDRNIHKMANFFRGRTCQLRPHFKNHKCTALARRQMEAGSAVGLTCAKVSEAEVLVDKGFANVLIANQVVGRRKVARLAQLAWRATVRVAVDNLSQAIAISKAASFAGVTLGVLIEVDTGMHRCGVSPGKPALVLAGQLMELDSVDFWGIQAFEGHVPYINDFNERLEKARQSYQITLETRQLIENHGITVQGVSGGCSSTYAIEGLDEVLDELQCGTYATMDWRYHEAIPEFEMALTVLATVISRPKPSVAVLDLGVKGAGGEFGVPRIKGHPNVQVPYFLSEEHMLVNNQSKWCIGDTVQVIPSHACTTCNLYRQMYVHEDGRVVDIWPIEGSGHLT